MEIVEILVKVLGYTLVLYGVWRLIGQYIVANTIKMLYRDFKRSRYSKRLHQVNKNDEKKPKRINYFHEHIRLVLLSLSKTRSEKVNVLNFYVLSLFLFGVTAGVIYMLLYDVLIALAVAMFFSLMPYTILRLRLVTKRLKTSMAFMNNFHLIIQSYHSTGNNGYHMIMNLCKDIEHKELKNSFMKLLAAMQRDRHEEDLKEVVRVFAYTINSSFAIRFGNLLVKSYLYQSDISLPLKDLNQDISERKNDLEKEKSQNVEVKILGYLPIIVLPIFVFVAYKFSVLYNFWDLFTSTLPITIFIIATVYSIISLFLVLIFSKPRSDV